MPCGQRSSKATDVIFTKTLVAINSVIIGLFTFSFTQGPYSSTEQEIWYRWISIGFLVGGVLLPAGLVFLQSRKAKRVSVAINIWLVATLFGFIVYLMLSGGGV